ncbi:MAG: DUF47 family protein [Sphingobacteriales bacterium]|nr:MAG: DUF47 family protein [Sphingobacteriales bacterium]
MSFLRQIFVPADNKFYVLLDKVTHNLKNMSDIFLSATTGNTEMREHNIRLLQDLVDTNKLITRQLFTMVSGSLVTPIDREDIHYLASGLNDIATHTLVVAKHIRSRQIDIHSKINNTVLSNIITIISLLNECLRELKFKTSYPDIASKLQQMKKLVNDSDNMIDEATFKVLNRELGVADLIKQTDHFDTMQFLLEKYGSLINTLEAIIIKYG